MLTLQTLFNPVASESYTFDDWEYRDVYVGFSRLYYVLDGEAYYEEDGEVLRLKKNHLYLTPVKRTFSLYENPEDKLLHTFAHIVTTPPVNQLMEIEVVPGTLLADAVALYRKHIHADSQTLSQVIQFLLSCIDQTPAPQSMAEKTRQYLDSLTDYSFDMATLSQAMGYSREYITRSFFAAYRSTPKQYFNQVRMNTALRLLVEGKKVFEVAEAVRFSSPYAFSKAFKRYYGLSPEKYLLTLSQPWTPTTSKP